MRSLIVLMTGPPKPEDAWPEDLELVSDDDAIFAMRLQFYRGRRGRMLRFPGTKLNMESDDAQRQEGLYVIDGLRARGIFLYRLKGRWVRYGGEMGGDVPAFRKWKRE